MLAISVLCGGYAHARLPYMHTKMSRFLMWTSLVSNGVAALIWTGVIAAKLTGTI